MKTHTVMRLFAFFLLLCLMPSLGGCATEQEDYFSPFRAPFRAQIDGKAHGVSFCAFLEASKPRENGARTLALTFYAPESLADTTLSLNADGKLSVCLGDLVLESDALKGLLPLLTLFPTSGEVQGVELTDHGYTRVRGVDFVLDFLPDGTPYRAQNSVAEVTVIRFEEK